LSGNYWYTLFNLAPQTNSAIGLIWLLTNIHGCGLKYCLVNTLFKLLKILQLIHLNLSVMKINCLASLSQNFFSD